MDRFTLDILEKDQELKSELIKTLSSETFQPYPSSALSDRKYREFVLSSLKKPAGELSVETKSITSISIDRYGFTHPVLLIKNDFVDPMPQSEVLAERIRKNKASIKKSIRASGRVEKIDGGNYGTAWIVDEGIAVTSSHVIKNFSQQDTIIINFKGEDGSDIASRFAVKKILKIYSDVDIAFLQLDVNNLPAPISLNVSFQILSGDDICIAGYPSKDDGSFYDQDLAKSIFNHKYDVKQLSIGQVKNASSVAITHNCNTLPGNSGAAIFSYQNQCAIGIHLKGYHTNEFISGENYAVPASIIAEKLKKI